MAVKVLGLPQNNKQAATPESWGEFGKRNLAQTPANIYSFARSGAGLGDVLDLLKRTGNFAAKGVQNLQPEGAPQINAPQGPTDILNAIQRIALPTQQQGREEAAQIARAGYQLQGKQPNEETIRYLTEQRPGDWPQAVTHALGYAALGIPLTTSAAMQAGSYAGGKVGGALGELTGNEEAKELAQEWGGLGGGILAAGAKHAYENRGTSKATREKVAQAERAAFEEEKTQRINAAQAEYDSKIAELEAAKARRIAEVEEKGNKTVEERKAIEEQEAYKLAEARQEFEKAKVEKIKAAQAELDAYDQAIKDLDTTRTPNYNKAKELESNSTIETKGIQEAVTRAAEDATKGVGEADRDAVYKLIAQIETQLNSGELPTKVAKQFQKNINERIYRERPSNALSNIYKDLRNSLNEYINAANSPEHNVAWNAAERATQEMGRLRQGRPEFKNLQQRKIQFAKGEKFSPTEEVRLRREAAQAKQNLAEAKQGKQATVKEIESEYEAQTKNIKSEHEKIIDAIGKESYEKIRESKTDQNKLVSSIEDIIDLHKIKPDAVSKYGLAGLGGMLGWFFGGYKGAAAGTAIGKAIKSLRTLTAREIDVTRSILDNNRPIFNEVANIVKDATVKSIPALFAEINSVGKKIEEKAAQQQKGKVKVLGMS